LTSPRTFFLKPLTLTSVALIDGGRTTRPCSMPATFTSWMYVNRPFSFEGTSGRLIDFPTILCSLGFFVGALPVTVRLNR
jgi:hypothetical protein